MLIPPAVLSSATTFVRPTQVFTALLIPYLVGLYRNDYDTGEWSNWVRVLGYFVIWVNAVVAGAGAFFSIGVLKWPVTGT